MALLRRLAGEGRLVMVVMHDLGMASRFCDRLLLLSEGRLAADGGSAEVLTEETLRAVYGVEALIGHHQGQRYVMPRSEEHTSELQSLMRISYAVFCLKK